MAATCFLSYSDSYRHAMVRLRDLLESIGFQVEVFDDPVDSRADNEARRRIIAADCFVALIGPHARESADDGGHASDSAVADYPIAEAQLAITSSKPAVLIFH